MKSVVKEFICQDGRKQRVQVVTFDSFKQIDFLFPQGDASTFEKTYYLYNQFIVPRAPFAFGQMLLFYWDDTIQLPSPIYEKYCHLTSETITMVKMAFAEHIKIKNKQAIIDDEDVLALYNQLLERQFVKVVCGKLPYTKILPVGHYRGYLSDYARKDNVVVNSSFFVMDCFDCTSDYDNIGQPIGLMCKDNKVINQPLFNREALIVNENGDVTIKNVNLQDYDIVIADKIYRDGVNMKLYQRPQFKKSRQGYDIIVVNQKVVTVKKAPSIVPSSGYIINVEDDASYLLGQSVSYNSKQNYIFALQVGNSVIINGEITKQFKSYFSNIYNPFSVTCPPSLYPLNYQEDKAPRIVLGADKNNKPMLLWFEGEGKFSQDIDQESCGVSLQQCALLCQQLGLYNGIHLDGGGSAQILYKGERKLRISDRNKDNFAQEERGIPVALLIK